MIYIFNQDFFPTPPDLAQSMIDKLDFKRPIKYVLEPSAGKLDLVKAIENKMITTYKSRYNQSYKADIDCIELDDNLRSFIKGEGYRLVHDDFLSYYSFKMYDILIANFPFSEGDKHALKAIEMMNRGGQLVFLINAETLKNPYSYSRKQLLQKLEDLNADIEYIQDGFIDAERTTSVEIALVYLDIPKTVDSSIILDKLKSEEKYTQNTYRKDEVIDGDFLVGITQLYNFEVKAVLKLIDEYEQIRPMMTREFKGSGMDYAILKLQIDGNKEDYAYNDNFINQVIKRIRHKYWTALFSDEKFVAMMTTDMRYKWHDKIDELSNYDFSLYNIQEIQLEISKSLMSSVEKVIIELFDEFSHAHSWYPETTRNSYLYDSWKTNKAYKINKKVIIPLSAYGSWDGRLDLMYKFKDKLQDIEKVFNYLAGIEDIEHIDLLETLKKAQDEGQTKKINTKYFIVDVFKKKTTHLTFKDHKLLDKFNIYCGKSKKWLPPTFGNKFYDDMDDGDKKVVDSFCGNQAYVDIMQNKEKYIFENNDLKLLELR